MADVTARSLQYEYKAVSIMSVETHINTKRQKVGLSRVCEVLLAAIERLETEPSKRPVAHMHGLAP